MGRSRAGGRRRPDARTTPHGLEPLPDGVGSATAPSLASATLPRVWQGIGYRPLPDPARARPLFDFAALPWPDAVAPAFAWAAERAAVAGVTPGSERLLGAVVAEQHGGSLLLHGPVVVVPDRDGHEPLEVAAQLVAASLDHATAAGAITVFARPHGLDRVWIRFGFVPVPESTLPAPLAGRPGAGLYAWRGGSALWTLRETSSA